MTRRCYLRRTGLAMAAGLLELGRLTRSAVVPTDVAAAASGSPERRISVRAGGDLQAALDQAQPGDTIVLEARGTYIGPFTLPLKTGQAWITIQTSALDEERLPAGRRIGPGHGSHLAKLVAAGGAVFTAAAGAHHYRLVGLEISPEDGVFLTNLVELGTGARTDEELPHHIVFDRCYLHGDPQRGTRRGLALNVRQGTVEHSHLSDFKDPQADSQAIAVWNSPGPITIVDNYLEGAGENIMIGGADPLIRELVPADIEIRRNHVSKPLAWKPGEPGYTGARWMVKNLLELKNARRVHIAENLFEHNWAAGQNGFAILFTVRNQDGRAPWSVVEDVAFRGNVVRHAGGGINILGRDDVRMSQPARRLTIRDNLFLDVGGSRWGGRGILFQLLNGAGQVVIEHNTALQTGSLIVAEGPPHAGFVYRRNVGPHNAYGIVGTGTAPGHATLQRYFPNAIVEGNVIPGADPARYPPGNFFPSSLDAVQFRDGRRGDYGLANGARYRRHPGDRDPGVDADTVRAALAVTAQVSLSR